MGRILALITTTRGPSLALRPSIYGGHGGFGAYVRDIPEAEIERIHREQVRLIRARPGVLVTDEAAWSGYGAGASEAALPRRWGF